MKNIDCTQRNILSDRNFVNFVKGIAIIMMVTHHFCGFRHWISSPEYYLPNFMVTIGKFCKLCVGMFAFLNGYGMCFAREKYSKASYRFQKALIFLGEYHFIYFIVLAITALFGEPMPNVMEFLQSLIGLNTDASNNYVNIGFAWYVYFYLEILLVFPIINRFCRLKPWWLVMAGALIIPKLLSLLAGRFALLQSDLILEFLRYIPCVLVGYIFANNNLLQLIFEKLAKCRFLKVYCFVAIMVIYVFYFFAPNPMRQVLYVSVLIVDFYFIYNIILKPDSKISSFIIFFGKYSMEIWFTHAVFFTPLRTFQKYATFWRISVLSVLFVLIVCLFAGIVEKRIYQGIVKKIKKIKELARAKKS